MPWHSSQMPALQVAQISGESCSSIFTPLNGLATPAGPDGEPPAVAAAPAVAVTAGTSERQPSLAWECQDQMDLAVQSRGATEVNSGPQQQCLLPFVCRATQSAALHSALLSLELSGSHPVPDSAGCPQAAGLESTLAQLLALHCRAGLVQGGPGLRTAQRVHERSHSRRAAWWPRATVDACLKCRARAPHARAHHCSPTTCRTPRADWPPGLQRCCIPAASRPASAVSGASLLAALWLLQSVDSCHWSDASTCLSSWCRHLAAFSPQVRPTLCPRQLRQERQLVMPIVPANGRAARQGHCRPPLW